MVHPDSETRVGAHRIFSVVLVPSSVCPYTCSDNPELPKYDIQRTLSRTTSVFSSSASLFQKLRSDKSVKENEVSRGHDGQLKNSNDPKLRTLQSSKSRFFSIKRLQSSKSRIYSMKGSPLPPTAEKNSLEHGDLVYYVLIYNPVWKFYYIPLAFALEYHLILTFAVHYMQDMVPLRLSGRQISLLLSSLWVQAISPENIPQNYEAIAHTYGLSLLFSRAKVSTCYSKTNYLFLQVCISS